MVLYIYILFYNNNYKIDILYTILYKHKYILYKKGIDFGIRYLKNYV